MNVERTHVEAKKIYKYSCRATLVDRRNELKNWTATEKDVLQKWVKNGQISQNMII